MESEKTETYKGLSRMLDILYSKFWAATAMTSTESKRGDLHERNGRRTKRIKEFLPVFAFEGDDFTASATDIGIDIKRLPEMINRAWTRHCTDIEQDANIGLENGAKGVEEPTMGIDLLLIFLLETKDDLHGHNTFLRAFELVGRRNGDCIECKMIR